MRTYDWLTPLVDELVGAEDSMMFPLVNYALEQVVGENGAVGDPLKCTAHFALRGKATVEKASDLFDSGVDSRRAGRAPRNCI